MNSVEWGRDAEERNGRQSIKWDGREDDGVLEQSRRVLRVTLAHRSVSLPARQRKKIVKSARKASGGEFKIASYKMTLAK